MFENENRVFLPVIHPVSFKAARDSVDIAVASKADGIFLINQGLSTSETLKLSQEVIAKYPNLWVGLNILGYAPSDVLNIIPSGIKGIWADSIENINLSRKKTKWNGLFFGGVAFKYQKSVALNEIPLACREAMEFVDVITTSGPGTGKPASIDKIKIFREALGSHPLALASGVDINNIQEYLPYVNAFLVGTSIEKEFGVLDAQKTQELSDAVHG